MEPQLKYERIGNDVSSILSKDAASCLAVHSKVNLSHYRNLLLHIAPVITVPFNIKVQVNKHHP